MCHQPELIDQMHGKTIRAGDKLLYWFVSGNRDETVFDDPNRVDLFRTPNKHLAFGLGGPHLCLGVWLARLGVRAMFCDHLSILRGKYLPASKIGNDETRFCQSTFGVHYDRDLLASPGSMMMEGLPDMELRWDAENVRDGWEPAT